MTRLIISVITSKPCKITENTFQVVQTELREYRRDSHCRLVSNIILGPGYTDALSNRSVFISLRFQMIHFGWRRRIQMFAFS